MVTPFEGRGATCGDCGNGHQCQVSVVNRNEVPSAWAEELNVKDVGFAEFVGALKSPADQAFQRMRDQCMESSLMDWRWNIRNPKTLTSPNDANRLSSFCPDSDGLGRQKRGHPFLQSFESMFDWIRG